jgi:hypothetical protein
LYVVAHVERFSKWKKLFRISKRTRLLVELQIFTTPALELTIVGLAPDLFLLKTDPAGAGERDPGSFHFHLFSRQ